MPRTADGTAWEAHGPEGAPGVVLIHGLGLARGIWEAVLPELAARHRVIAYDLHGHGESGPAPGPVTLGGMAAQCAEVMDAAGLARAGLVGFSIGGMVNRRLALDRPGRVAALAILNAPHARDPDAQGAVEARAAAVGAEGPMATLEAALERWFTPGFRTARPDVLARVRDWRAGVEPRSYAGAARVLAEGVRELVPPAPAPAGPALVMTSAEDTGSTPAMAQAIAGAIPGAELLIVRGLRHLGLLERPAAFAGPIRDFLERNPT